MDFARKVSTGHFLEGMAEINQRTAETVGKNHLMDRRAGEVATRDPLTVPPDMLAAKALAILNERKINVLIVCEDDRPVGVLHIHDLLRAGVA